MIAPDGSPAAFTSAQPALNKACGLTGKIFVPGLYTRAFLIAKHVEYFSYKKPWKFFPEVSRAIPFHDALAIYRGIFIDSYHMSWYNFY
jgi:hypothetical protein